MKAAFGLRADFFFAVFFAMQSPLEDAEKRRGRVPRKPIFPLKFGMLRISGVEDLGARDARWGHNRGRGDRAGGRDCCSRRCSARPGRPVRRRGWGRARAPYDGRFTFVRLRWDSGSGGGRRGFGMSNAWNHDFPRAEQNLMALLDELTLIDANRDGSLILSLDDPQLFRYPDRLHVGTGLLDDRRPGGAQVPRVSAEGRLRHLRRLRARTSLQPAGPDAPRPAGGALRQARRVAPRLRFVLPDEDDRFPASDRTASCRPTTGFSRTTIRRSA